MITVGLTGGIACGKSTAAAILREQGFPVLDLDVVAREVVAPGTPGLTEIAARWPNVVREGVLDRKALGAIVVVDAGAKAALEAIAHPRIWQRMEEWMTAQSAAMVFVEAALMVETGSWRRYDQLWVVSCSPDVQRARLAAREGFDAATVERWIAAQMPLGEKEKVADVVIRNDGDREELARQIAEALSPPKG